MKTKLHLNRIISINSFVCVLNDLIKEGYTVFFLNLDNHFILSNQDKRNSKKCSFKCDQSLQLKDDKISTLLESLKSTEKKYILTNDLSFNSFVNFK